MDTSVRCRRRATASYMRLAACRVDTSPCNRLAVVRVGRREAVAVAVGVAPGGRGVRGAASAPRHRHPADQRVTPERLYSFADTAPIFGWWNAHVGWGTVPAIVIGIAAVLWGQTVAQRLPWRALPWVTWATACAWAFSLAMIDGWQRGLRRPAHRPPRVPAPGAHGHRHSRGGAHASPAESLISNRIRGSPTCRAIRPARC